LFIVATVVTAAAPWTIGEHELRIEEEIMIAQRKRIFFILASNLMNCKETIKLYFKSDSIKAQTEILI
jgi:hypothetical protein